MQIAANKITAGMILYVPNMNYEIRALEVVRASDANLWLLNLDTGAETRERRVYFHTGTFTSREEAVAYLVVRADAATKRAEDHARWLRTRVTALTGEAR